MEVSRAVVLGLEFHSGNDFVVFGDDAGVVDIAVGAEGGEGFAAAIAAVVAYVVSVG